MYQILRPSPDGLDEKYKKFHASGDVLLLLKLDDGGLAALTDTSTVDFSIWFSAVLNCSAVSLDGLDEKYKTFQARAMSFYC